MSTQQPEQYLTNSNSNNVKALLKSKRSLEIHFTRSKNCSAGLLYLCGIIPHYSDYCLRLSSDPKPLVHYFNSQIHIASASCPDPPPTHPLTPFPLPSLCFNITFSVESTLVILSDIVNSTLNPHSLSSLLLYIPR